MRCPLVLWAFRRRRWPFREPSGNEQDHLLRLCLDPRDGEGIRRAVSQPNLFGWDFGMCVQVELTQPTSTDGGVLVQRYSWVSHRAAGLRWIHTCVSTHFRPVRPGRTGSKSWHFCLTLFQSKLSHSLFTIFHFQSRRSDRRVVARNRCTR